MKKLFILITAVFFLNTTNAEITSQTLCFENQKNKNIELLLRTYVDNEIQKEIGALVKYKSSKNTIPLVFVDDDATGESADYVLNWLEIFDGKITGEYRLIKPKMATIFGAYVKYKSIKTGKETIFSPSGKSEDECLINLK
ncbi:MAG: hypothetical protein ABI410_08900 [Rhodoferax sp.]